MNKDWVQTTKDMSAALKDLRGGAPAVMQGFSAIAQAALKANALDTKTKERRIQVWKETPEPFSA